MRTTREEKLRAKAMLSQMFPAYSTVYASKAKTGNRGRVLRSAWTILTISHGRIYNVSNYVGNLLGLRKNTTFGFVWTDMTLQELAEAIGTAIGTTLEHSRL